MEFSGTLYHPGDFRVAASQVLQLAFFGGLGVSLIGKSMLPDAMSEWLSQNQMASFGAIFGCNILSGKLINTGAFEIYYDGKPVWSKLDQGRFPELHELTDLLRQASTIGASNQRKELGSHDEL